LIQFEEERGMINIEESGCEKGGLTEINEEIECAIDI